MPGSHKVGYLFKTVKNNVNNNADKKYTHLGEISSLQRDL